MLTLERVFEKVAASVRRAVRPASIKLSTTLVHRSRGSRGKRAVASCDVQALDGEIHAPVPAMPSQHQPRSIGVPGTDGGGEAAAKSASSAK